MSFDSKNIDGDVFDVDKYQLIDLTYPLTENIPAWDLSCGFKNTITTDYDECSTDTKFRLQELKMVAGIGTHMDAPAHCFASGKTISELKLETLFANCVVIDVSAKADEKYVVSVDDISDFESKNGLIDSKSLVFFNTGWSRYWPDRARYRNNLEFPRVSEDVARLLLSREVAGIGVDTLSPDCPSTGFHVHQLMLSDGKYIIENVANINLLPVKGAVCIALPLNIKGGTESPIRLVAVVKKL